MKFTTPARAAPGVWSAGIICSPIASSTLPSAAVRQRQGVLGRLQDTSVPHAVAPPAIRKNLRRCSELIFTCTKADHSALHPGFPPPDVLICCLVVCIALALHRGAPILACRVESHSTLLESLKSFKPRPPFQIPTLPVSVYRQKLLCGTILQSRAPAQFAPHF